MDDRARRRAANYTSFAGIWFFVVGGFNVISGIAALVRKEYFAHGTQLYSNLQAWGWIWIIVGVLGVIVGWQILSARRWARFAGIILAMIGLGVWFFSLGLYPFWAIVNLVIYGLIIYGLTIYGDVFE